MRIVLLITAIVSGLVLDLVLVCPSCPQLSIDGTCMVETTSCCVAERPQPSCCTERCSSPATPETPPEPVQAPLCCILLCLDMCVEQTALLKDKLTEIKDRPVLLVQLPALLPPAVAAWTPGRDHPPNRGSPMRLQPLLCVWRN